MKADIVIVGGAGHIGLPLGMLFANKGKKVILYDKDKNNVTTSEAFRLFGEGSSSIISI